MGPRWPVRNAAIAFFRWTRKKKKMPGGCLIYGIFFGDLLVVLHKTTESCNTRKVKKAGELQCKGSERAPTPAAVVLPCWGQRKGFCLGCQACNPDGQTMRFWFFGFPKNSSCPPSRGVLPPSLSFLQVLFLKKKSLCSKPPKWFSSPGIYLVGERSPEIIIWQKVHFGHENLTTKCVVSILNTIKIHSRCNFCVGKVAFAFSFSIFNRKMW